ncbi:MAG: aminotransferase class V-fold PLP-dependent enzyme [Marinilabiliales bacterium]|nr:aminotransferase class V-fold PLP-dependent enzyme [Marinilabiliales bacterium]
MSNPFDGYNILPAIRESAPDQAGRVRRRVPRRGGHHQQHDRRAQLRRQRPRPQAGRRGPDIEPRASRPHRALEAQGEEGRDRDQGGPPQPDHPVDATRSSAPSPRPSRPKTRIISISHTVFITGLIMPLKELSKLAHDKGLLILADSAHGIGMLDLDLKALGIDFFASSPYKWLGAPTGVGLLYVRKEALDKVHPTVVSSGWENSHGRLEARSLRPEVRRRALRPRRGPRTSTPGSARPGSSAGSRPSPPGSSRSWPRCPAVKVHTPVDPYLSAGLTAFSMAGAEGPRLVDYLREKYNLVVRTTGNAKAGTYGIRVSTPIYISTKEVDMVVEAVRTLLAHKA